MDYHIELRAFSGGREPPTKSQLTLWVRPGAAEEYMVRLEIGALGANLHEFMDVSVILGTSVSPHPGVIGGASERVQSQP